MLSGFKSLKINFLFSNKKNKLTDEEVPKREGPQCLSTFELQSKHKQIVKIYPIKQTSQTRVRRSRLLADESR